MHLRSFLKTGHIPTLACAFLYFDVSFMVWVLLGALANSIAAQFGLSAAAKGLLVAVPLLGGALLRVALGLLSDRWGARRTGTLGLALTLVPLLLGWLWATSFARLLLVGLLLGVAGASFAVALPLASRWYPRDYQGIALGIAGAGNSGTALATFFGPRVAAWWGWQTVFGLALVPVLMTLAAFVLLARDGPEQPAPRPLAAYLAVLRQRDSGWFCLFYAATFGGFVGLASFLNVFFHDQYDLGAAQAATFATACVLAGSFLRPVGGYLADRLGGLRLLRALYGGVTLVMLGLAALPPAAAAAGLLFVGMGLLGMANGAVFQLVPLRFPREIGVLTGIVGAAGGLGGFVLLNLLGTLKQLSGSFAGGFLTFALANLGCAAAVAWVSRTWEATFVGPGGRASSAVSDPSTPGSALTEVSA